MRRRQFIGILGSSVAAWSLPVRAQQPMPVIGFLNSSAPDAEGDRMRAYRRSLGDVGYVEGRNVGIEYRWADGQNNKSGDHVDSDCFPAVNRSGRGRSRCQP
jgi:putative tryptophan/tyrosine transport system substrate-binding protein